MTTPNKATVQTDPENCDMQKIRMEIDSIDEKIVGLINRRAELASSIGQIKAMRGEGIFNPAREEEVLQNLLHHNHGPLSNSNLLAIYREIISSSRALQHKLKVAFLGPEYSFSHVASMARFGQAVEFHPLSSISMIFEEVERKHVDFAVVPLENSTDGRITDTLDMFVRLPQIRICAEVRLRVHHHLLAICSESQIKHIYSKPQALSQCRGWLSKTFPEAVLHEISSTAAAAQYILENTEGTAAIASREAAVRYGLRIAYSNIEDSPDNETRFAVIGTHDSKRTGRDKTAIMFQIPHSPGSLADILNIFKQTKINLTWIESFPSRQVKGEYVFFVEFEGHKLDEQAKMALELLSKFCDQLTVLGSFPLAQLVD